MSTPTDWRTVAVAGHRGDHATARAGLSDVDPATRAIALGALARMGMLDDHELTAALTDPSPEVRRRAAQLAAAAPLVVLLGALDDDDPTVAEVAAWACGERVDVDGPTLTRLIERATTADDALVREACVAALGAIGDERGLPAILSACTDKPAVRRRAVLALAPFSGPAVDAAITAALTDRDWQVRQAAEDIADPDPAHEPAHPEHPT